MKPVIIFMIGFISFIAEGQVTIHYTNERATSITINTECNADDIIVRLKSGTIGMLGALHRGEREFKFTPAIPFSPDYTYEVLCNGNLISSFSPDPINATAPGVLEIYPLQDTVPENLLKMHIRFSQPMAIGKSYRHFTVKEDGVPVKPFLELEAELWNEDHTIFTLWLDPGRIKRDLAPNRIYGNPLVKGKGYELVIDSLWKGRNGKTLNRKFTKSFQVSDRDEELPDPTKWNIVAGSTEITLEFNEPLDYLLLRTGLSLIRNKEEVPCTFIAIGNTEMRILPGHPLDPGDYILKIDPKLEDLAGNNLTRLFDRDLHAEVFAPSTTLLTITIGDP